MGKAMRWLRALLGMKREKNADQNSYLPADGEKKERNRCSFSKSGKEFTGQVHKLPPPSRKAVADADWQRSYPAEEDCNEHAIAVAAASAAAADAAVAAAQAAAAVVRLANQTGGGGLFNGGKEISAALTIQKVFRGFLARKALQALRSLVKLQALVRGFLVRKRAAATLQSMQALIRAQTTVRSQRARRSNNKENKSLREKSPDGDIGDVRFLFSDEIEDPKIVEIDTLFQKPKSGSRHFNSLLSELADDRASPYFWTMASPARFSGGEWCFSGGEECRRLSTAHSTPRVPNYGWTAAATATPGRVAYGEGVLRPYTNFPNYMASTKSFKAKLRSRSAPKQRAEVWTKNRVALNEIMGARNSTSGVRMQKCCNRIEGDEGFDEL